MWRVLKWLAMAAVLAAISLFAWYYVQALRARPAAPVKPGAEAAALTPPPTWHAPAGVQAQQRGIPTVYGGCSPPPGKSLGSEPLQTPVPRGMQSFVHNNHRLKPLFGFSVDATVMSAKGYSTDREAKLAPVDLALAWGRMRDDAIIKALHVTQDQRWYHWRWYGKEPLPTAEIIRSSANMHMIPSNDAVRTALQGIQAGDDVRIDGWLIEARGADGWSWRSSTQRGDTGQGGCEVIYVCAVTPVPRNPQ